MSNDKVVDSFNIFTCNERGHAPASIRLAPTEAGEYELNMSNHKIDIEQGQFFRLTLTKFNMLKNYLNVNSSNDRFFLHTVDASGVERNKEVCLTHGDFETVAQVQLNFIYALIKALGPITQAAGSNVERIIPQFPIDVKSEDDPGFLGVIPAAEVVSGSPSAEAPFTDWNENLFAKELNFGLSFVSGPMTSPTLEDHKLNQVVVFFFDKFVSGPSDCYKLLGGARTKGFPTVDADGNLDQTTDDVVVSGLFIITDYYSDGVPFDTPGGDFVRIFPDSALAGGGAFDPEAPPSDSDSDSDSGNPLTTAPPTTVPHIPTTNPPTTDPNAPPPRSTMVVQGYYPMHLRTDQAIYLRTSLGSVTKNLESTSLSDAIVTRQNESHVHHSNIFAKLTPQFNNDNDYVNFETQTGHEFFLNLYNLKHLNSIKFSLTDSHGLPLQRLSSNPTNFFQEVLKQFPPVMSFEMVLRVDIIEKNARNEAFTQRPNPGIDPKFSSQITKEQGLIRNF